MEFLGRLRTCRTWAASVKHYLASHFRREKDLNPLPAARSLEQFSPILAMFVFEPPNHRGEDRQPSLSSEDYAKLLVEHVRLLQVLYLNIFNTTGNTLLLPVLSPLPTP